MDRAYSPDRKLYVFARRHNLYLAEVGAVKAEKQAAEAKAVCACCLVRRLCLAFALRTRQAHGIWGGLTEDERRRLDRRGRGFRPAA